MAFVRTVHIGNYLNYLLLNINHVPLSGLNLSTFRYSPDGINQTALSRSEVRRITHLVLFSDFRENEKSNSVSEPYFFCVSEWYLGTYPNEEMKRFGTSELLLNHHQRNPNRRKENRRKLDSKRDSTLNPNLTTRK